MLKRLIVKDFAIIEDVEVCFDKGMTVLTGETGAGKSLLIDTISLLLGERADTDMIRYTKDKAIIIGEFEDNSAKVKVLLEENLIPILGNIKILREINSNGKNVIKINDVSVSLQVLKKIAKSLADIHIQNDTVRLFNPDNYLSLIDPTNDDKFNDIINSYTLSLMEYNKEFNNYNHILNGKNEGLERLEFLKFEYEEINNLNLTKNIDVELEEKINKLKNFDKIFQTLKDTYYNLDNEMFNLDNIYSASKSLSKIKDYDVEYDTMTNQILDSYYILDEIKSKLEKDISNLDYDEDELNSLIKKLNEIDKIKDKYKKTVDELISYKNKLKLELDMVYDYDNLLDNAKNSVIKAYENLKSKALILSNERRKRAIKIENGITNECKELDLQDTIFKILFNDVLYDDPFNNKIFLNNGVDIVTFNITFNKGEPLRALHKVASGGEMSRIMLAFKSYFSKENTEGLMVFDEIDTGVSGQTAKKIAIKMKEISTYTQVLCITHLPQVASIGNYHKHIYKILEDGRTKTQIKDLTRKERIEEIALMLSGDKLSLYALEHAESLLNENGYLK